MKSIFSILVISGLAACGAIQPTGSISNVKNESAILASNPICQSVRSTFWGGGRSTWVTSIDTIVTDDNNHVYVAGETDSPRLPGTQSGFQPSYNPKSSSSGYVAVFSKDLRTLIAATYLGGPGPNVARALAVGKEGQIYVAGQMGVGQAFIAEFTPDLKRRIKFVLAKIGPIRAMAVAPNGHIYVVGGGLGFASGPEYVVALDGDLKQIQENMSFGGGGNNWPAAVAIGPSGDVYVAGDTSSTDFPKTLGGAQPNPAAGSEAFVIEFSNDLEQIMQATYFGGKGKTEASALVVTKQDRVYLSGHTSVPDLPGTGGAAQSMLTGSNNAYIVEFSSDLKAVVRATYVGGTRDDEGLAMVLSNDDQVFIAGRTNSDDFPGVAGGVQRNMSRGGSIFHPIHGFISKVSADLGRVIQSSYYMGVDYNYRSGEEIRGIALGSNGYLYLAGDTQSTSLPCGELGALTTLGDTVNSGFVARYPDSLRTGTKNEDP